MEPLADDPDPEEPPLDELVFDESPPDELPLDDPDFEDSAEIVLLSEDFGESLFAPDATAESALFFAFATAGVDSDFSPEVVDSPDDPSDGGAGRLSVMYQPEPLKTIAGGCRTRRVSPPHVGHTLIASSLKLCFLSKCTRQARHSYSYVGIICWTFQV